MKLMILSVILILGILLNGCFQGTPSEETPIHLNPNMDNQEKYLPFKKSNFFADGSAMRMPVEGTVARGQLREDDAYYLGKNPDGTLVKSNPLKITMSVLKRGQQRYNIYCAPCHDQTGSGQGMVVKKGFLPPPSFHLDRIRVLPDGHYYDVITNGIRDMPSYKAQVPVYDRWAIVAYSRALQKSQNATTQEVPEEIRSGIK
jgi:hypothetical protein